jgi:hypothetical protein
MGHEVQKTRPALIVQNDIANRFSPITIVAAITSKFKEPPYPGVPPGWAVLAFGCSAEPDPLG